MILITGATGHFGKLTIDFLLKKGVKTSQMAAFVRNAEKAADLSKMGIKVLIGDYNDYDSLVNAFTGIDKLLFVSGTDLPNRTKQHERVLKAATAAGIQHIIYTSGEGKIEGPESPLWTFAEAHIKTEKWLKESGLTYTILKNSLYMEYIPYFIGNVLETGTIYLPAGKGKISVALRSEMAEATATILATEGYENKSYHFVNTEAYGYEDVARYITEITGKTINYISPTEEEFRETLKQQGKAIPEEYISILLAQAQGVGEVISDDMEKLIGRKLTPMKAFLQEVYQVS
ncbi:SDR family oxidoreductase [Chitinophaga pinensis]|uniref:NmrA family protein n=1 Tax=Chitinophaga pinensis (strain ATCC 43595 / DSM 2588 / LMG 13176 / NBRC 15968 / NCIMB 11800 / UQM 2034) TaxID=485918 RepID=A0A979GMW7_CHIPD|nr:SDR family oxidoreductase [Chitinophaga pinensis]ACU57753.1 NmrA family protein [Chitinophaga pinensis DSM 2588]